VTAANTGLPLEAEVRVLQVHHPDIGPRMTEASHGMYWRLLLPGTYTVTVMAEDHYAQTQSIYVSGYGWTRLDFQLTPDPAAVSETGAVLPRVLWADSPLRPGGSVHFSLSTAAHVSLDLLDVSGRQVMNLQRGWLQPGPRAIALRRGVPAGCYLLRLRTDEWETTQQVVVVD
jgi:hypothetical protein